MNQYQAKVLELMQEIDKMCTKHGIPCFLAYQTALQAFQLGRFSENAWNGQMMIFSKDFRRFTDIVEKEKGENRTLSYLGNDSRYPGFTLYYANSGTLCISKLGDTSLSCTGLGVTIYVICDLPGSMLSRLFGRVLEVGMIRRAMPYSLPYPARMICKWFVCILLFFYGKDKNQKMLNCWLKLFTKKSAEKVFTRYEYTSRRTFTSTFFLSRKRILLEGVPFSIPGQAVNYFTAVYGVLWESYLQDKFSPPKNMLFSTTLSYQEFVQAFGGQRKLKRCYRKIFWNRLAIGTIRPFQAKIDWAWSATKAAGEKLMLEDRYQKNKKLYRNLFQGGAYEQLQQELKPYRLYRKKYESVPIKMEDYLQQFIVVPQDDETGQVGEAGKGDI